MSLSTSVPKSMACVPVLPLPILSDPLLSSGVKSYVDEVSYISLSHVVTEALMSNGFGAYQVCRSLLVFVWNTVRS